MRRVLAVLLALTGAPALAHPHVFIEAGLTLWVDAGGVLQAVGVEWVYDELTSLLAIEDLGLDRDNDGILTGEERAVLDALAGDWGEDFNGDLLVRAGGAVLPLSGPEDARGDLRDGRVVFSHTRLVTGAAPGRVTVAAFDPTYYIYYELRPAPVLIGPPGCAITVEPADFSAAQRAWDQALSLLTEDQQMNEDNLPLLGEAFADTLVLTCG